MLCLKVQYYIENGRLIWYVLLYMFHMHLHQHWTCLHPSLPSFLTSFWVPPSHPQLFFCLPFPVVPVNEGHGIFTILTCGNGCSALNVVSRRRCTSSWQVMPCRLTLVITRCQGRIWKSCPTLNPNSTFPLG